MAICFYSGLPLSNRWKHQPGVNQTAVNKMKKTERKAYNRTNKRQNRLRNTKEHLVASSKSLNGIGELNVVPAAYIINSIIGSAPLIVKFGAKAILKRLDVHDMDRHEALDQYVNVLKQYLKQFKMGYRSFPWDYKEMEDRGIQQKLKAIYLTMLSPEEKMLIDMI